MLLARPMLYSKTYSSSNHSMEEITMKTKMAVLMAASLFAAAVPAMAMDMTMDHSNTQSQQQMDAQCAKECDALLRNCSQETDTIQQRIQKLQSAITSKGDTYTLDQLRKLKANLEDAQKTLIELEKGGR